MHQLTQVCALRSEKRHNKKVKTLKNRISLNNALRAFIFSVSLPYIVSLLLAKLQHPMFPNTFAKDV